MSFKSIKTTETFPRSSCNKLQVRYQKHLKWGCHNHTKQLIPNELSNYLTLNNIIDNDYPLNKHLFNFKERNSANGLTERTSAQPSEPTKVIVKKKR